MLRQTFLFLSRRRRLRRWFETSRHAARLTARFVAGESLDDALRVCQRLNAEHIQATLDHLGENVTSVLEAEAPRRSMEAALTRIDAFGLAATISIKLSQFGLDLGADLCRRNVEILVRQARAMGSRVEIDMESSEYVDRTLALACDLNACHGAVRSVLQAYLYRTEADARRLCRLGVPVRLCKGAYNEPRTLAMASKRDVDENYLRLARLLLDEGVYPAIATHDPRMIDGVLEHVAKRGQMADAFEFQMLYGVRRDLQRTLVERGFRLRLYVPYGDAWYPYFMRRLAERPANALFIARNLLRA